MAELVGKHCACEFTLPFHRWPFAGTPAWVRVVAVDMPMVKLCSRHHDDEEGVWVNASIIQTIRES